MHIKATSETLIHKNYDTHTNKTKTQIRLTPQI